MNQISTLSTFLLFGRTAARRLINRSASMKFLTKLGKKTPGAEAPERTATLHRAEQTSMFRRLLGMWLPLAALSGLLMLTVTALFTILDTTRLTELRTAAVFTVSAEDYQALQDASAIGDEKERAAAVEKAISHVASSAVSWLSESTKQLANARFAKDGLKGFKPLAPDARWSGTLAYLSPAGRGMALRAVGGYFALLTLAFIGVAFGMVSANLSSADPAMVWLWQFPVSRRVLFIAKLAEYLVDTPVAPVASLFYATVLWLSGFSFGAGLGLGLLFGLSAALTGAALRLASETFLMQRLSRRTRGAIVAIVAGTSGFAMLVAMLGSNAQAIIETFVALTRGLPEWFFWNPLSAGIGTEAMLAGNSPLWWLVAPAWAVGLSVCSVMLSDYLTRSGLACGQDSVRDNQQPATLVPAVSQQPALLTMQLNLSTSVWKELLQLRRQPELLAQVLITPFTIFFLLYLGGYRQVLDLATHGGTNVSVAILAGASYLLLVAATQMLNSELKMLWLLQSQPRPLADVIRGKARVWGVITIAMTIPFVGAGIIAMPSQALAILIRLPFLICALWWLSELTFGLAALGANVSGDQKVTFRRSALWLPAMIASDAGVAIYSDNWWVQLSVLAILVMLNAAVRERQLAELAYLSDPVDAPPANFYAMHALLAVMGFQALKTIFIGLLAQKPELSSAAIATISFCLSALIVSALCWDWMRRHRITFPAVKVRGPVVAPMSLGMVVACSVGLAVSFSLYWLNIGHTSSIHASSVVVRSSPHDKWYLLGLFVVAAPLFEEWVFRGLLYRTLRRTWGVGLSTALSATLFATLHPFAGCVALLTLGTTTALVVEKTGRLWPSILIHAVYNLMIWQLWVA